MPEISIRGRRMPESPIRKLAPYAEIAKKKGLKVYHLNIGQPDIKSPEIAIEAIKNMDLKIIEYGPSAGYESYRKKLAQFYINQSVIVGYEDIMITTGGSEALLFALGSIMDPGDEVVIPEPFYANYSAFSEESSATVVPVISNIESGFTLPTIEEFEKAMPDVYGKKEVDEDSEQKDMTGKKCAACKKGAYEETSANDDMDGVLHCTKCNKKINRWKNHTGEGVAEGEKPGLWANIHAKQERIKHGSGERMRKPGSKGAPTAAALKKSAK